MGRAHSQQHANDGFTRTFGSQRRGTPARQFDALLYNAPADAADRELAELTASVQAGDVTDALMLLSEQHRSMYRHPRLRQLAGTLTSWFIAQADEDVQTKTLTMAALLDEGGGVGRTLQLPSGLAQAQTRGQRTIVSLLPDWVADSLPTDPSTLQLHVHRLVEQELVREHARCLAASVKTDDGRALKAAFGTEWDDTLDWLPVQDRDAQKLAEIMDVDETAQTLLDVATEYVREDDGSGSTWFNRRDSFQFQLGVNLYWNWKDAGLPLTDRPTNGFPPR